MIQGVQDKRTQGGARYIEACRHREWMRLRTDARLSRGSAVLTHVNLQHSPSSVHESERGREVLDLDAWECLGEYVGSLVVRGDVQKSNRAGLNGVANEMIADLDMLCAGVIRPVLSERDG